MPVSKLTSNRITRQSEGVRRLGLNKLHRDILLAVTTPTKADTITGLSEVLNKKPWKVADALDWLVRRDMVRWIPEGLLRLTGEGEGAVFIIASERAAKAAADELAKAMRRPRVLETRPHA